MVARTPDERHVVGRGRSSLTEGIVHSGMDLYDLVVERNERVAKISALPPAERIEALEALRAEVKALNEEGPVMLGERQIARALVDARREMRRLRLGEGR